ncbi:helix-turn-helix transcriptional regulator [Sphingomicrobium sp. XHP0235]|uniref:helix-turn-helix domain-containing protein n=1 Tax=Sphingomicrobium aquimarinum TaxID=3133971 RepID=UPI0031FF00CD
MQSRIRDVRRAKGLTLAEVAERCDPPTTAQTIGRLETGTRTLSLGWVNRIASALGVDSSELVAHADVQDAGVDALLDGNGTAKAPTRRTLALPPQPRDDTVVVRVVAGVGDYRAGDDIWCKRLESDAIGAAMNRDVLVPRPAGRYLFGRLIDRQDGQLLILPPGPGSRQSVVKDPAWVAVAETLVRTL